MRKIVVIGVSILSVFILCSLSYQPIIADTPIETITQVKKSKVSNLNVDELKELYNRLIEMKSQSKDDCGCENDNTTRWSFPVLCTLLAPLFILAVYLLIHHIGDFIVQIILAIGSMLNCPWG